MIKKLLIMVLLISFTTSYAQTFPATGVGDIPDRGAAGCGEPAGDPLALTFDVSGVTAPLTAVEVDIDMTHSWIGDLTVTLIAPDTTEFVIFGSTGSTTLTGCGSGDDLLGIYNFTDDGTDDWWALGNPYPVGDYRTTTIGDDPTGGTATDLSAAFSGVTDVNGTWTLTVTDSGGGDTGSFNAANLFLMGEVNLDVIFANGFETITVQ